MAGHTDDADAPQELELVRARIAELSAELADSQLHRDALAGNLRRAEEQIARTTLALQDLDQKILTANARLADLGLELDAAKRRLAGRRALLARQLAERYMLGRQEYLKVLLSQRDPSALGRGLAYHDYLTRALREQASALVEELANLETLEIEAAGEADRLRELHVRRLAARRAMERERAQRQRALAAMGARIAEQELRLSDLRNDERDLAELVRRLEEELEMMPLAVQPQRAFANVAGELRWPAGGDIRHAFGTPLEGSDLRWRGVMIGSPAGEPVHAVWSGRVVFADWLKGFGLLLIIDHGEAYMSLYGHNEALHKRVGDEVRAGEVIATVGNSGGQLAAGLYFEIRHQGEPQDPADWCTHPSPGTQDMLVSG